MKIKTGKLTTIIIKENSITLAKDAITMTTNAKIKILSKTWGEPKKKSTKETLSAAGLTGTQPTSGKKVKQQSNISFLLTTHSAVSENISRSTLLTRT